LRVDGPLPGDRSSTHGQGCACDLWCAFRKRAAMSPPLHAPE
jgi:hypothetical protein